MGRKKREPQFYGTFWGIKDGKVRSVDEYLEQSGVSLTSMNDDGVMFKHHVMRGRQSSTEVVVVFNLTKVRFVSAMQSGTEYERKVREELQVIIDSE